MAMLGVLCIGGNQTHQETHAAGFALDPRTQIVAVADEQGISERRRSLNIALAEKHGVPYIENIEEAVSRDDVDIISMCADVERRERVAIQCAESGKFLYLDKPLAGSASIAEKILDAITRNQVTNQMYSFVHTPWARAARACVMSGRLGDIKAVNVDILFAKGPGGTNSERGLRVETEVPEKFTFVESKREFFDLGVYPIGLGLWLSGGSPTEVSAVTGNYFFEQHLRNDTEDFGAVVFSTDNGVTVSAVGGRIGWDSHPAGGPHRITVIGTKGTERFDAWEPRLEIYGTGPKPSLPEPHPQDPMGMWRSTQQSSGIPKKTQYKSLADETAWYSDDIRVFIDCVMSGKEPIMTAARALDVSKVISAAYVSAANRIQVEID